MRIKQILTHVENLTIKEPQTMGSGHLEGTTDNLFICIKTDSGICGYGEAPTWNVTKDYTAKELQVVTHEIIEPILFNKDPFDIELIEEEINCKLKKHETLKCAIDVALLDIIGKATKNPVYKILGNAERPYINLSYSVSGQDVEEELKKIQNCYEEGYRIFKIKVGCLTVEEDLYRLDKIIKTFPDADIRVDFNQNIKNNEDFIKYFKFLTNKNVRYIEQPFEVGKDLLLREYYSKHSLFVADESCVTKEDLIKLCREDKYNAVSLKVVKIGGLSETKKIAQIAFKNNLKGYAGSTSETTLTVRATINLFCTFKRNNMLEGTDSYFPFEILKDEFMQPALKPINGRLYLSEKPGIGCEPPRKWFY